MTARHEPARLGSWRLRLLRSLGLSACLVIAPLTASGRAADPSLPPPPQRVSAERTGVLPTRDALTLTLTADSGSVRLLSDASGEVRYRVVLEAEAGDPGAQARLKEFSLTTRSTPRGVTLAGRMPGHSDIHPVRISYELHVPLRYNLRISTQAGEILAADMDGQVTLSTGGGHITVGDVAGALRAATGGGHITAGDVFGDATLETGGGHIRVGRVAGTARLSTGGGNILAQRAAEGLVAETAGGRMELAEATGSLRARTVGGGMRIARVVGPTRLDSGNGGISLAGIQAPVRVSTRRGSITAWFSAPPGDSLPTRESGFASTASELLSGQGDIIVYLPREMPVTIDAVVEERSARRVFADPALPLELNRDDTAEKSAVRRVWTLNGGGRPLRLRAGAGNIQLRSVELGAAQGRVNRQMARINPRGQAMPGSQRSVSPPIANGAIPGGAWDIPADGRLAEWTRRFEGLWWGGVRVDPVEQQKRLVHSPAPEYPEAARRAGIEGQVALGVRIGRDGSVEDVRLLAGEPVLGRAAMAAVEQWRYAPLRIGGRPMSTVTTVTLAFELR